MPNSLTDLALVETATKCRATDASSFRVASDQSPRAPRVGHRLQGGEGLRGDDEQGLLRVEVARRLNDVGPVDVAHEAELDVAARIAFQSLVGHDGAEVGAADADVHDRLDGLAGESLPLAAPHLVGEGGHASQDLAHGGDDVLPVEEDRRALGRPEGDMEHGAVLRGVDPLAAEHRVAPGGDPGLFGEPRQEAERLVGDQFLRVVEVDPLGVERQPFAATGIAREKPSEIGGRHRRQVVLESLPSGQGDERRAIHRLPTMEGGGGWLRVRPPPLRPESLSALLADDARRGAGARTNGSEHRIDRPNRARALSLSRERSGGGRSDGGLSSQIHEDFPPLSKLAWTA